MTQQRKKEIGIRKVLGASVAGIVGLLSRQFLLVVTIAIFVASPLAYLFMNKWLEEFAYRMNFGWWIGVAAGVAVLAVAFLTLSLETMKAARANPVKSLKDE